MTNKPFSRFVSIDIETTGLDENTCDIIEIGAVIDDWLEPLEDPPTFHCYLKRGSYKGEPYALSMHPIIFRRIAEEEEGYDYHYPNQVAKIFGSWMRENGAYSMGEDGRYGRANVAGKCFANFDHPFLKKLPDWVEQTRYVRRVLDPGMLYWNPLEDDCLPSLDQCMARAGIEGIVPHTALEDAILTALVIHKGIHRLKCMPNSVPGGEHPPFNTEGTLSGRLSGKHPNESNGGKP